ncbi:YegS/Rv2252/BmrU family lipid kinase [Paenibacillus pini]|uniref:Transcription regulator n=1 Tax=Paenibacillus pini JCM 16418 TaxID=1236976 RepID=W7Z4K6_9BACL|nr:YegS/Rv2252/BmrU family lipid kinase [Paenibacillus pini]GAF09299.1 transcription regulator [Paenibacillus pini JCM 16418]
MKKAMIIINPSSGKEQAEENLSRVEDVLKQRGYLVDIKRTEKEQDATIFATNACQNSFDAVISMGGDGTLNEIINGLAEQPNRPALGIIPLGTVNDFARALQIPLDIDEAIQVLELENSRPVDIGKVNDSYFMNIVAVGKIAEASFSVSSKSKTFLGPLAYFMEGIKTMVSKEILHVRLQHDHGVWEGESLLILTSLTNSVGGFEKIAPDAEVDDGLLKCIVIRDVPLFHFAKLAMSVLKGNHVDDPAVEYISTSSLQLSSTQDLCSNIDGDQGEELPLNIIVLARHLNVFVP